jgi:SET domain-containing protein
MNAVMPLPETKSDLSFIGPVYVAEAGEKGRGVFASRDIKKGELIERAPVIIVPLEQNQLIDKTRLYNYYYAWTPDDEGIAVALGYGSIYNHSYTPNALFERRFEKGVVDFYAVKDIAIDEEIVTNYNGDPEDQDPIDFFEVR